MFSASPRCGPRVLYKCAMYSLGWSVLISTLHKFDPAEFLDTPLVLAAEGLPLDVEFA